MNENEDNFDIGEFASFNLVEDEPNRRFTITVTGDIRYADLLAHKIGELIITKEDLKEWVDGDS